PSPSLCLSPSLPLSIAPSLPLLLPPSLSPSLFPPPSLPLSLPLPLHLLSLSAAAHQLVSVGAQRCHAGGAVARPGERRPAGAEPAGVPRAPVCHARAGTLHAVPVPAELAPPLLLRAQRPAGLHH